MLLIEANISPGEEDLPNRQINGNTHTHTKTPSRGLKREMTIEGLVKKTSSKAQKHSHEIVAIWHLFRHMALQTC